jgi:hypothetical protein
VNKKAYRAIRDTRCPGEPSLIAEEHVPECFTNTRQLAPLQVQSSRFPGRMGEEQRTAYVANKTKAEKTTSHLLESTAILTSTIPPSLQTPHIPLLNPSVILTPLIPTMAKQRANDVVSRNKKTSASECLPEDPTAGTLPFRPSAHQAQSPHIPPMQTTPVHQPPDKPPLPAKTVPRQRGLSVVNGRHLAHSKDEGTYLERAASYIREHINGRSSACDTFIPRVPKEPPDKMVDSQAPRRHGQEVVRTNTTSAMTHSPHAIAALPLLAPRPDADLPSASLRVSPACPKDAHQWPRQDAVNTKMTSALWRSPEVSAAVPMPTPERRGYTFVSEDCESPLTPCSIQALPSVPTAPDYPASPNNDLVSKEDQSVIGTNKDSSYDVRDKARRHTPDVVNKGDETDTTHSLKIEEVRHPTERIWEGEGQLLIEAAEIHECSDKHSPKDLGLTQRVHDNFEPPNEADAQFQQPSQEAAGNIGLSAMLRSLRPAAAFTQHAPTPEPVSAFPAYSRSRSSPELEFRLRWKPPDNGEDTRRHAYCAVNKKTKTSVTSRSPKSLAALMPLVTSPALPQACSRCLSILELAWRTRCKPPDMMAKHGLLSGRC